jgi:hypothetical protein
MNHALVFTPDGQGHGLYTEAIDLGRIGQLSVARATNIEFCNKAQCWKVRDRTGFALFSSPSRQTCLDWEHQYFNGYGGDALIESTAHTEDTHELQHRPGAIAARP